MSNRIADQITEFITIPDALKRYGYGLGRNHRIPCPIHRGKDANFSYTDAVYHCWTCESRGNVIHLVRAIFGLDFGQALIKINSDFGLGLTKEKSTHRQRIAERKHQEKLKQLKQEKRQRQTVYFRNCALYRNLYRLLNNPKYEFDGLAEYLDELENWLDEHIEEVRT